MESGKTGILYVLILRLSPWRQEGKYFENGAIIAQI
jgi:hypothetical protein